MSYKSKTPIIITSPTSSEQTNDESKAREITEVLYHYKKKYSNFNIICSIIAAILSWYCNKNNPIYVKILYVLIALLLSYWYLIFYLIYYVFLNNSCSDEIIYNFYYLMHHYK